MKRLNLSSHARRALLLLAAMAALAHGPAWSAPTFVYPLNTKLLVEASAANGTGVHRDSQGTGPISDAASELFGLSTADSSASVDALGLHASASVHNDNGIGLTAGARSGAGIVNPFT